MLRIADVLKFYVLLILVLGMAISVFAQEMHPSLKDSAKKPVTYMPQFYRAEGFDKIKPIKKHVQELEKRVTICFSTPVIVSTKFPRSSMFQSMSFGIR